MVRSQDGSITKAEWKKRQRSCKSLFVGPRAGVSDFVMYTVGDVRENSLHLC